MSLATGTYRHYKGNLYRVIDIARHSENLEEMVVYQALYGEMGLWVRPRKMFEEMVTTPAGEKIPRFEFVDFDHEDDDEDDEMLTVFSGEKEAEKFIEKLEEETGISAYIRKTQLNPAENKNPNISEFYSVWVHEDYFEDAAKYL